MIFSLRYFESKLGRLYFDTAYDRCGKFLGDGRFPPHGQVDRRPKRSPLRSIFGQPYL